MIKIDLKKQFKQLYSPPTGKISVVDVPAMNFIMIDGSGDPNTSLEYRNAIEALYALSYTLKFMVKKAKEVDYVVPPLEGLWWVDNMSQFTMTNKGDWKWTAMIMQPEYVSDDLFNRALEQVAKKKDLASLPKARFHSLHEGLSVQTMFIGPYAAEGPTIENLHLYARENGYTFNGVKQKHHEIYLSDPRKSAPEKLKTVIRQPLVKS
jgi:hypothetical protein